MKSILHITFILIFFSVVGCSGGSTIPDHPHWSTTGNAQFDSLTTEFLRASEREQTLEDRMILVDSMECIAKTSALPLVKIRTALMKSSVCYVVGDYRALADALKNAFSITDSAKYPHEYNMLLMYTTPISSDYAHGYKNLSNAMRYFEATRDSSNITVVLLTMASINWGISREAKALELSMRADTIFQNTGKMINARHNKLNLALYSNGEERIRRLHLLLSDSVITSEPLQHKNLLTAYFMFTDSIAYLQMALKIIEQDSLLKNGLVPVLALTADWQLKHSMPQEALATMRRCLINTDSTIDIGLKAQNFGILARIFKTLNIPDSACTYLESQIFYRDSLEQLQRQNEIVAIDFEQSLEKSRYQASIARQQTRLAIVIIIALVIIAVLIVAFLINRIRTRTRLRQMALENDLQRAHYRVEANTAVIQEMDKLISDIKTIAGDTLEGKEMADKIDLYMRMHEAGKTERESFLQIHNDVSPNFTKHLKADFPSLTEAQLRMCAFIAAGISNTQISQTLNISRESVHKARYRLRLAFGLDKQTTLEDFLRRYSS